jgi:hypothetical protein
MESGLRADLTERLVDLYNSLSIFHCRRFYGSIAVGLRTSSEEQEESPEPNREDIDDTIVVECGTSDRGSESSDDSDDENYIEEPP